MVNEVQKKSPMLSTAKNELRFAIAISIQNSHLEMLHGKFVQKMFYKIK